MTPEEVKDLAKAAASAHVSAMGVNRSYEVNILEFIAAHEFAITFINNRNIGRQDNQQYSEEVESLRSIL